MNARSLRILPVVGVAVAALWLSGCSGDPAQPADTPRPTSAAASSWMETTYGDHPDTTLGRILIPGTHDSGSGFINTKEPCDNQVIAGTPEPISAMLVAEPCALAAFSRAQDVSLRDQLESGIRYLDLRVGVPSDQVVKSTGAPIPLPPDPLSIELVLHHTVVSQTLTRALDDILAFAHTHPKEQVILDFQHVDLPKDPNVSRFYEQVLAQYLLKYVPDGGKGVGPVCSRAWTRDVIDVADGDLARKVTFGHAWKADRNLVVLAEPDELPANPCFRNRDQAILSQWPETQDPAVSSTYNRTELEQRQAKSAAEPPQCQGTQSVGAEADGTPKPGTEPANWCGFFVSQMQLSVDSLTYGECVLLPEGDCSLFALSQLVNQSADHPSVAQQLVTWSQSGFPTNTVIVDFFNYSNPSYAETLIERNRQAVRGG